jgi:hypothetical protein
MRSWLKLCVAKTLLSVHPIRASDNPNDYNDFSAASHALSTPEEMH